MSLFSVYGCRASGATTNAKALGSHSLKLAPLQSSTSNSAPLNPRSHTFTMAPKQESSKAEIDHKTKKFGKSERKVPSSSKKAKKFYPAEDEAKPKKVCVSQHLYADLGDQSPDILSICVCKIELANKK